MPASRVRGEGRSGDRPDRATPLARAAGLSVLALALGLVTWAAATGPGRVLSGGTPAQDGGTPPRDRPRLSASDAPRPHPGPGRVGYATHDLSWVSVLLQTLLALAVLGLLVLLARRLLLRLLERSEPGDAPAVSGVRPDAGLAREQLRRDRDDLVTALGEGSPRNGIVACWVRFERTAADAGVVPRAQETSTELVLRLLHRLDVDPRAVGELTHLYQEARFSSHELGEDARERARAALERIDADLVGSPA